MVSAFLKSRFCALTSTVVVLRYYQDHHRLPHPLLVSSLFSELQIQVCIISGFFIQPWYPWDVTVIPWHPPSWFLVSCHVSFPANIREVKASCVNKGLWHRDFKFFTGFSCYLTLIREPVTDFSQDVTLNSLLPDPNLWALSKIVSHPIEKLPESVLLLCTEGNSLPMSSQPFSPAELRCVHGSFLVRKTLPTHLSQRFENRIDALAYWKCISHIY